MKRRVWIMVVLVALSPACADDRVEEPVVVTERDSAGVTIVENAVDTAALRTGWALSTEPTLVIGGIGAREPEQLYDVEGGVRLDDGRIVIVNAGSAEVRVFTPHGELESVFGREGDGPGEFRNPSLAGRGAGDSLVVFDAGLRRATVITPDAGPVRSFDVGSEGGGFPLALGTFDDGGLAMGGGMAFTSAEGLPSGLVRPDSRYVIVGPDGEVVGDLGDMPSAEMWAEVQGSSFRARPIAFGRITAAEPAAGRLWIGTADSWELRAFRPDATLERIVRLDRVPARVTPALREAWIEDRLEDIEDPDEVRRQRAELSAVPAAEQLAPYQLFKSDRLGNLWIGESMLPGEEARTWTVIDRDGRAIGRLTLPLRTLPLDIGQDYMLGVTRDELDVESLTLWVLTRGG